MSQTVKMLQLAVTSPRRNLVKKFIKWCLESFVKENNLQYAIDNDLDILTLALNHYGIGHSEITPLFKFTIRMYWKEVEQYLTDVNKVLETLSKDEACRQLLSTEKGRNYLNRCCKTSYEKLYEFTWIAKNTDSL
jgi:hypothetical protein